MGSRRHRSGSISVAGFIYPYSAGFPVLAYPGRKALPPVFADSRQSVVRG
jgi:hypothetical protein